LAGKVSIRTIKATVAIALGCLPLHLSLASWSGSASGLDGRTWFHDLFDPEGSGFLAESTDSSWLRPESPCEVGRTELPAPFTYGRFPSHRAA
jgi:hypothetical protein